MTSPLILVVGWEPKIRPYVKAAILNFGLQALIVSERPMKYSDGFAHDYRVIPDLYSNPSSYVSELAALGRVQGVAGVITFEDSLAWLSSAVARRLGLVGPDPSAVRTAMNKADCRSVLAAANVPGTDYVVVSGETPAEVLHQIEPPVVVKPVSLSGGYGVFLVNDFGLISKAASKSRTLGLDGPLDQGVVLLEKYIEGRNVTVEIAAARDSLTVMAVVDTDYDLMTIDGLERFRLRGLSFPSVLPNNVRMEAIEVARRAVHACGLNDTVVHVELRCSPSGVRVIEVNPRAAGAFLPEVVELCSGCRYTETALAIAIRKNAPPETEPRYPAAAVRFFPVPAHLMGAKRFKVLAVTSDWGFLPQDQIYRIELRAVPGDLCHGEMSSLGYIISVGNSPEEARDLAESAVTRFQIITTSDR